MRLLFAGTPEPAALALEALLDSEHEVVGVLTRPDARRGRGRTLHPSPVAALAQERGIEVLRPRTLKPGTEDGEAFRQRLQALAPDCIPVVAYGFLITEDLLDAAPHGWINLHFSLLPRWRGAAPVQAAVLAGDAVSGVSTFRIEAGLDTGPVLLQQSTPLRDAETSASLMERLTGIGAELLCHTMTQLAQGTVQGTPQEGEATYAGKITPADAELRWDRSAQDIDRAIRAYTPHPGAWTTLRGQRIKLGPVSMADVTLAPGEILVEKHRVLVGTGTTAVELDRVQPPGKRPMPASDWGRGLREEESKVFGS